MAESNSENYPSLPSNYISIAQLQERWLKEKQRKQQEKENEEKKNPLNPVPQNHHKHKHLQNHSGKGWREVGLIAKEPKSKEVKITAPVVEESVDGGSTEKLKKKKGYFRNGKPRVERDEKNNMANVSTFDVAKEEIMIDKEHEKKKVYFRKREPRVERDGKGHTAKVSRINVAKEEIMTVDNVKNGGRELSKGKYKWNGEYKELKEVATVFMVEVVGDNKVYKEHERDEEEVLVDVKERRNEKVRVRGGALHGYGDKRRDIPLIDKIEKDVGNLSLSDRRRYGGHRRPSVRVYRGDKWRYGSTSRRYEPRKMLKNVWVKKGESANGSVAETETQVDFSSQSTSQSQLCPQ